LSEMPPQHGLHWIEATALESFSMSIWGPRLRSFCGHLSKIGAVAARSKKPKDYAPCRRKEKKKKWHFRSRNASHFRDPVETEMGSAAEQIRNFPPKSQPPQILLFDLIFLSFFLLTTHELETFSMPPPWTGTRERLWGLPTRVISERGFLVSVSTQPQLVFDRSDTCAARMMGLVARASRRLLRG
jgi:hypothetical protein